MAAFEENARDARARRRQLGTAWASPPDSSSIPREPPTRPPLERIKRLERDAPAVRRRTTLRDAGRALHGLRHPVLPHRRAHRRHGHGLPDQQPHPGVERPRLPRPVARGVDPAPQDEQLPRVHRARLPGAVRGGVHARHQRAARSRSRPSSRRSSTGRGRRAGSRRSRRRCGPGKRVAVVGSGPGRAWPRRSSSTGRPHRHGVRARRPHRRPAHVRHPEHEARQGRRRAPRRAHGGRGRDVRHRTRGRRGHRRASGSWREFDAVVLATGATAGARPAGRGPRAGGDPPRDGVPARATRSRCSTRGHADGQYISAKGKRRHRHRRRRHRDRLRRDGDPPRREERRAARDPAAAAASSAPPTTRGRSGPRSTSSTTARRRRRRCGARTRAGTAATRSASSATQRARDRELRSSRSSGRRARTARSRRARSPAPRQVIPADLVLLALGFLGPGEAGCRRSSA